jgi:hypothetical protein
VMGLGNGVHWVSWFIDRKKPTKRKSLKFLFSFFGHRFNSAKLIRWFCILNKYLALLCRIEGIEKGVCFVEIC